MEHNGTTLIFASTIESFWGIVTPIVLGGAAVTGYDREAVTGLWITVSLDILALAVLVYMRCARLFVTGSTEPKKRK